MAAIYNGKDVGSFGIKLCKILGLDSSKTKNIIIKVMVDDVVMVQVDQYFQDYEADKLLQLMKEYKLESKDGKSKTK